MGITARSTAVRAISQWVHLNNLQTNEIIDTEYAYTTLQALCVRKGVKVQETKLVYCPASGEREPKPGHADAWREQHQMQAWIFNPWTGKERSRRDIEQDADGRLIVPPGEKLTEEWERYFMKLCRAEGALGQLVQRGWAGKLNAQWLVVTVTKGLNNLTFQLTESDEEEHYYALLHDEVWRHITE